MIYLDNAATTLRKPASVSRAAAKAARRLASPGRGGYPASAKASEKLYLCRSTAAELFSVSSPENVIMTSSATHGLNIAIKSLAGRGDRVLISGYEHNAVTRPLRAVGAEVEVYGRQLFDPDSALEELRRLLRRDAAAVICTHVSNVFGYVLPIAGVAELCREAGAPLIIDASQSAGALEINMEQLGAAFIAMPGHKGLYGLQGTGLLLCGDKAETLMEGGTGSRSESFEMPEFYPDRLEAGTHNMPGICALTEGMSFVQKRGAASILRHERRLIDYLAEELMKNPRVSVYAARCNGAQAGVLSFNIKDMDCERTAALLSEGGFALRAGLHCAPLAHESAGTLKSGTVRAGVSAFSSMRDVERLAGFVNKLSKVS